MDRAEAQWRVIARACTNGGAGDLVNSLWLVVADVETVASVVNVNLENVVSHIDALLRLDLAAYASGDGGDPVNCHRLVVVHVEPAANAANVNVVNLVVRVDA